MVVSFSVDVMAKKGGFSNFSNIDSVKLMHKLGVPPNVREVGISL